MRLARYILILSFFLVTNLYANGAIETCVIDPLSGKIIPPDMNWLQRKSLSCKSSINISAAKGEYEPASLVLRSDQHLNSVKISVTNLVSGSHTVDSKFVDIKYVKSWYQANSAYKGIHKTSNARVLVPELLLNNDALIKVIHKNKKNYAEVNVNGVRQYIDISKNHTYKSRKKTNKLDFNIMDSDVLYPTQLKADESKQIWLTIHIPIDTKAGLYAGNVIVDYDNNKKITVPINVEVYPFVLDEPIIEYSLYYRGVLDVDEEGSMISSDSKSKSQMKNDFKNMLRHGVTNPTIYQPYSDVKKYIEVLELREEAGLSNEKLYYLGMTTGNYSDLSSLNERYEVFQKLNNISKKYGNKELYVYGIDEADVKHFEGQYPVWEKIHRLGGKIFVAAWKKERSQYLSGKVDVFINGANFNAADNKINKNMGTKVYLYNRPQVGVENPEVYRVNYGITAWKNGFDGVMNYAYQDGFGEIWNDFDHYKYRDHVFSYPTANGLIDTIAWEGFREGVDDVRYLSTLINLVMRAQNNIVNEKLDSASDFLKKLKNNKIRDLNEVRRDIASHIKELCCAHNMSSSN